VRNVEHRKRLDSNGKNWNCNPVEGPFGSKILAICNHCGVMTARSSKTRKLYKHFWDFWKNDPFQTVVTAPIAPKICQRQPPHLAHTVPDFIQIGSLSAELLPNAWRPFLPRRLEYLQYRLFEVRAYEKLQFIMHRPAIMTEYCFQTFKTTPVEILMLYSPLGASLFQNRICLHDERSDTVNS